MNTPAKRAATLIAALACTCHVMAHHSYAMFDGKKRVQGEAVVARLEWKNPHVYLWLHVRQPDGKGYTLVGLESDSTNALRREGWTGQSLSAGQPVVAEWFPLRDGRPGGHLIRITTQDGKTLKGGPATAAVELLSQTGARP